VTPGFLLGLSGREPWRPLRPAGYYFATLALGLFQTLVFALWLGLGEVTPGFLLGLSGREPWIVLQNNTPPAFAMGNITGIELVGCYCLEDVVAQAGVEGVGGVGGQWGEVVGDGDTLAVVDVEHVVVF
jgi:hypothetical protein